MRGSFIIGTDFREVAFSEGLFLMGTDFREVAVSGGFIDKEMETHSDHFVGEGEGFTRKREQISEK